MNARNGKIARLPREIREELNNRLERSEQSPQLLDWLNSLKDVKEVLRDEFDGVPISKQNLSEWRQGGFQEWLARQELWAKTRDMKNFAEDLGEERDNVLADDVATVLAAQYAALISTWNGQPDAKFESAARVLNSLCRAVVQLQRGMHRADKDNRESLQELEAETQKVKENCKKRLLDHLWSAQREPMLTEAFGGGESGRKLAKYIIAVENDMPRPKLDITNEDLPKSKPSRKSSKPVKPIKSKRSVKPARKTKPVKVSNPLKANGMEEKAEPKSSHEESNLVKVDQTDLAESNDALPPSVPNPNPNPNPQPSEESPATNEPEITPICPILPISPISPPAAPIAREPQIDSPQGI